MTFSLSGMWCLTSYVLCVVKKNISRVVSQSLFTLCYSLLTIFSYAQTRVQPASQSSGEPIQIINADELQYSETGGVKLRKLTGNVQLKQNDVILFCNQADYFLDENVVDATGSVHIKQSDTINVYGDFLHYDGNTKKANLKGKVRLTDSHAVLTTDQLDYDLNTRVGNYFQGGKLVSDQAVLTSKRGYYFASTSDVYFKQNVLLKHPEYTLTTDTLKFNTLSKTAFFVSPTNIHSDSIDIYCEGGYYNTEFDIAQFEKNAVLKKPPQTLKADTIYYERLKGFGIARSNIHWADTGSKIFLQGNYAQYYENGDRVLATQHALLISVLDNDSMFMTGDTLSSYLDTSGNFRRLFAYHHVKIFKSDMQGVCDSVAFSFKDSTFRLFRNPVLWVDKNQLKADTINVFLRDNKIDKLNMIQNAFAANLADTGMYNQVKGRNMYGYFKDGNLDHMDVIGNGESIYYAEDDEGAFFGVNKAVCSNMVLYFDSTRGVQRIYFITEPDATLYPLSQFPKEESRLRNFVWLESLRPKSKEDLLK